MSTPPSSPVILASRVLWALVAGKRSFCNVYVMGYFLRYLHLDKGAPREFEIRPRVIPHGRSLIVAIKYPSGTTFAITWGAL